MQSCNNGAVPSICCLSYRTASGTILKQRSGPTSVDRRANLRTANDLPAVGRHRQLLDESPSRDYRYSCSRAGSWIREANARSPFFGEPLGHVRGVWVLRRRIVQTKGAEPRRGGRHRFRRVCHCDIHDTARIRQQKRRRQPAAVRKRPAIGRASKHLVVGHVVAEDRRQGRPGRIVPR